ncbi:KAP family P-loop NTPase fold protein [Aeromonas veronii]|uniref:KAP family P-loop NTPase fold protein n=1 Tax=Aeromonas veronii TaxID=654 RepID=UPI001F478F7D|nr:P-loop NTPase fold protein [Aeromonas veronii]MCF5858504.1 KAP family NTPase [Aeromonas veronii]
MLSHIEFDWSEQEEIDGDIYNPDCLDRAKYAEFLTAFLRGQDKGKPYVINLNSEWGAGKTYFLKRWKHDLSNYHPVIYIDAWKNDHSDDPLMSVVSSVISQLRAKTDKNEDSVLSKGYDFGARLLKQVAPIIVGGLAKKYIGVAIEDISVDKDDGVKSPNSNDKIDLAAQKITNLLMSEHDKKATSINALKNTMKEWIDAVIGQNSWNERKIDHPTFIIIDELDRCRPTHAVETLEIVKHIFDIPGVFFIIATDTEQLQHAIKAVYGSGFDAHVYLSRFFDTRFSLKPASLKKLVETYCNTEVFTKKFELERNVVLWPVGGGIKNIISILNTFNVSARDALQIVNKLTSILFYMKPGEKIDILFLTTLLCLQARDPSFQYSICNNVLIGDIGDVKRNKTWFNSSMRIEFEIFPDDINTPYKVMTLPLSEYYTYIFADKVNGIGMSALYSDDRLKTDLRELVLSIRGKSRNRGIGEFEDAFSTYWLRHSYIQRELNNVRNNKYRDYVELATAFD